MNKGIRLKAKHTTKVPVWQKSNLLDNGIVTKAALYTPDQHHWNEAAEVEGVGSVAFYDI